jgi:hypothetical protein
MLTTMVLVISTKEKSDLKKSLIIYYFACTRHLKSTKHSIRVLRHPMLKFLALVD